MLMKWNKEMELNNFWLATFSKSVSYNKKAKAKEVLKGKGKSLKYISKTGTNEKRTLGINTQVPRLEEKKTVDIIIKWFKTSLV